MNWTLYRWDCPTKHLARPKPTEKTRSEIHACTSPFHVHSVSKHGWDFECFQISEKQVGQAGLLHGQQFHWPAEKNLLLDHTEKEKGVELPITVFEPVGEQPGTPEQRELTTRYVEALGYYWAKRFEEALALWDSLAYSHHETSSSPSGPDGLRISSAMMAERSRGYTISPHPRS